MRLFPLLAIAMPSTASSATLTVGPGGFGTIRDALVASADGDTIEVTPGDYAETLLITTDVTLIGLGGLQDNSLSGIGAQAVVVDGATVRFSGFTVNPTADRGLVIENGASFTGIDLDISGFISTTGDEGIALVSRDSEVFLEDVVFDSNVGEQDGGAIQITDSLAVFTRITVTNNESGTDGALATDESDVFVHASHFEGNHAYDDGGAMDLDNTSTVQISDTSFVHNTSDDSGGAINAQEYGSLLLDGCTFEDNQANGVTSDGGAMRVRSDTQTEVRNTSFINNSADGHGGALDFSEANILLVDNVFSSNTAPLGGAIHMDSMGALDVDGDSYDGNTAEFGGAIYSIEDVVTDIKFATFANNDASTNLGGAIYGGLDNGSLVVSFSTFTGNTAEDKGGAVSAVSTVSAGLFSAINNLFTSNIAKNAGGAIYVDTVDQVLVHANTFCTNDGGKKGGAAAVKAAGNGAHDWLANAVIENISNDLGGGVYFDVAAPSTLTNNTFLGNESNDGGHVRAKETALMLVNNIFASAAEGDGVTQSTSDGTRDYNLWFDNTADPVGDQLTLADLGAGAVFADPDFVSYSADGDCLNDDLHLNAGSAGVDSGDPTISDRDGSPSDIGAYGGPDGLPPDVDEDGFNSLMDCDDEDPAVHPDAAEICDGIDNNCDGSTDGADAPGAVSWYADQDGDGFGNPLEETSSCYEPPGYTGDGTDCNDINSDVNPSATEVCDGIDQNCDGNIDEGVFLPWYIDSDEDGYGDDHFVSWGCEGDPGTVGVGGDCNDQNSEVHPGQDEACDGEDNNCDGQADEGLIQTWYEDADRDGYGLADSFLEDCVPLDGYSTQSGDCDDTVFNVAPQDCGKSESGCGCTSGSGAPGGWLVALAALIARIRSRQRSSARRFTDAPLLGERT